MNRLKETDVTQYRDQGYVVPNLTLEDVSLKRIERRLGKFLSDNSELSPRYIGGLLELDVSWISIARQPQILDTVEQLIGPDFLLWEVALFTKEAQMSDATPWQQDGEFWPIRPLVACTVWIALDTCTSESGCLRIVPESHRTRESFPIVSGNSEELGEYRAIRDQSEAEAKGQDVVLRPAQFCVYDVYTVYGRRPNLSAAPSRAIAMRFMPTTSHLDYDLAAIHAGQSGAEDRTSHQLHLMRGEDISKRNNFNMGRVSNLVSVNVGSTRSH